MGKMGAFLALISIGVACVGGGCGTSSPTDRQYAFRDGKGRECSHRKFGLEATCNATPAPVNACAAGSHACFIVYAGNVEANSSPEPQKPLWNCDACCKDGAGGWSGVSSDCAKFLCNEDKDCESEEGVCVDGQCRRSSAPR